MFNKKYIEILFYIFIYLNYKYPGLNIIFIYIFIKRHIPYRVFLVTLLQVLQM